MNKRIAVLTKIYKGDLNAFDEAAIETALRMNDVEVFVVCMGPSSFEDPLKRLTRLGCKVILISDPAYAGSDTIATSIVLAKALNELEPDLVFSGRNSFDGDTGQVPIMVSELLGFEFVGNIIQVNDKDLLTRNGNSIVLSSKQLCTFEKLYPLRSPSIFSKESDIKIVSNKDLNIKFDEVGFAGSPTKVVNSSTNSAYRRWPKFVKFEDFPNILNESLHELKKEIKSVKAKAPNIYYCGNIKDIASNFGEEVKELDIFNKSTDEVEKLINSVNPSIILWEDEGLFKEMACRIAIRKRIGLCANCIDFSYENEKLHMFRPALGGDVIAEIISSSNIAMATVKSSKRSNEVVVDVGVGGLENLESIKNFANSINASLVCSRPLANKDIFPYQCQVGLTGKTINPKVVITIGVGGAIQHIVGISGADRIISINKDSKAPIFDFSDYGIVMDANNIG